MSEKNHKGVAVEETSRRLSDASTLVPVKEDEMQRFTATGRPVYSDGRPGATLEVHRFYHDQRSHPVMPLTSEDGPTEKENASTGGLGSKIKQAIKGTKKAAPKMRVVKMTRGEYLKYWARDEQGNYIGTEPEGVGEELWKNRDSD
ncbi:MAG: hypothetical protein M1816_002980 [Peltula sp. TS41687]|nr:MAG: hypothetical protein M1816_002980 [Peltula sp. TS41687]